MRVQLFTQEQNSDHNGPVIDITPTDHHEAFDLGHIFALVGEYGCVAWRGHAGTVRIPLVTGNDLNMVPEIPQVPAGSNIVPKYEFSVPFMNISNTGDDYEAYKNFLIGLERVANDCEGIAQIVGYAIGCGDIPQVGINPAVRFIGCNLKKVIAHEQRIKEFIALNGMQVTEED